MLPHRERPDAIPDHVGLPPVLPLKPWPEFQAKIVPTLRDFYNEAYTHPVHIPVADREEMLQFLRDGPGVMTPPEWIEWGIPAVAAAEPAPEPATAPPVPAPNPRAQRVWRPFLQPRESRAAREARADGDAQTEGEARADGDAQTEGEAQTEGDASAEVAADQETNEVACETCAHSVGSWVAFEFGDDTFAGTITKKYEDEDLYHVVFTDGDEADYDGDEITYASQLYERDFNTE